MFLQVNLVTGEVENVDHKERGQTGEQMELDALPSISASLPLQKGNNHQHMNPLPKETHDRTQKVKRPNENNQSLRP